MWLVWPRDPTTWPERLDGARAAIAEAARHIAAGQHVDLVVHPELEDQARQALGGTPRIRFHAIEHQDSWIRDYGPLTLVDDTGAQRLVRFRFDAWGGKYETLAKDDAVTGRLADTGAMPRPESVDAVLEGGALDTDGQGTFLFTESVAAGRGQEPAEVDALLHDHLGAAKVLWLGEGVSGDDTDGHVDTVTRFVAPRTLVTTVTPDMDHPDHRALLVNRERLHTMTDALGRPLEVLDLPLPEPLHTDDGEPLPATHANFLVSNACVLVPTYGGISDDIAMQILQAAFPTRAVVPLDHRDLIWGMGGIHCLSMQVPSRA